jgi:hypothetical protein
MTIIDKYQIPNLTKYDYITIKNMTIYEGHIFNIYIIKNECKDVWQICIDMKIFNEKKMIELFNNFFYEKK